MPGATSSRVSSSTTPTKIPVCPPMLLRSPQSDHIVFVFLNAFGAASNVSRPSLFDDKTYLTPVDQVTAVPREPHDRWPC